jgi:hypothetical protein
VLRRNDWKKFSAGRFIGRLSHGPHTIKEATVPCVIAWRGRISRIAAEIQRPS